MSVIAGPGRGPGPYSIADLPTVFDAPPHDAPNLPYAALRARACTFMFSLPPDDERRRIIEYIVWRMRQPDGSWLHERLAHIIRPRTPGSFS